MLPFKAIGRADFQVIISEILLDTLGPAIMVNISVPRLCSGAADVFYRETKISEKSML